MIGDQSEMSIYGSIAGAMQTPETKALPRVLRKDVLFMVEGVPPRYTASIIIPKYAPKMFEAPAVSIKAIFENILFGFRPSSLPFLHSIIAFIQKSGYSKL